MITSSGAVCDVCGKYILPLLDEERVNEFTVAQIPDKTLQCDNACKETVLNLGGGWTKLPAGPLRTAYE